MTIARLMNQPLTIEHDSQTSTGTDDYGQPTFAAPTTATTRGYLEQQQSVEHLDGRDLTVSQWVCYLPANVDIDTLDVVSFNNSRFQVDGEPEHCWNPRTRTVSHIRCRLTVMGEAHA